MFSGLTSEHPRKFKELSKRLLLLLLLILLLLLLLLLPLALQPTVDFGLSNNVLQFFPICH